MKKYKIKIHGVEYQVNINDIENNIAHLTVNDVDFEVEVEGITTNPTRMSTKQVKTPAPTAARTEAPVAKPVASSGKAQQIKSPLPGVVMDIKVNVGDTIKAGHVVAVLEAMKMENNIESDKEGVVAEVNVQKGGTVLEGDVLITIK